MNETSETTDVVRLVRTFEVPAQKVYDAFTDPEQLVRWIGPGGPEATRVEVDPIAGGTTDIWIAKEEGEKRHFHWEIAEASPPNRLVLDFAFGGPIGSELTDDRSRLTVEIRDDGAGKSELTLTHDRLPADAVKGVTTGWATITGRLADYLEAPEASKRETEGRS